MTTEPTVSNTPPMPNEDNYGDTRSETYRPVTIRYLDALESWGTAGWAERDALKARVQEMETKRLASEHGPMEFMRGEIIALKAKLEEAENPRCTCELGQQADMACYHHGIGSPDHLAALESTLHGMERQYTKVMAQAAALAEALAGVIRVADRATDEFDAARTAPQTYREGR